MSKRNNRRLWTKIVLSFAYKSHYHGILSKINYTYKQFHEMHLLSHEQLEKFETKKFAERSKNLNEFIDNFNQDLEFYPEVTQAQKEMIYNFYYYLFYDLFIKYYDRDELEVKNFLGEVFKTIDLDKDKKVRKQQFQIIVNKIKREYYYLFLDEFQKIPGYNTTLRAILRKVL
ncbi:hypothetical protein ACNQ2I_02655 [Mycoplasma sp. Z355B]|uniref:hypothetical protein n=1 Tax=unclassified Mycoplasma TaxID=2683645 RepID=UPI003AB0FDBC